MTSGSMNINQGGNQKISRYKWQWKDNPKPMGWKKSGVRWKFIAIKPFLGKQGKPQINNIILHLKQLEKEEQTKPKVRIRGKSQRSKQKEIKLTPKNGRSKWN